VGEIHHWAAGASMEEDGRSLTETLACASGNAAPHAPHARELPSERYAQPEFAQTLHWEALNAVFPETLSM